jgi:hypothetical protein
MPSPLRKLVRAAIFVAPLACSESASNDSAATGGGGTAGGGTGGAAGAAGVGAAGGNPTAGTAGTAGKAGGAGSPGDARLFVPEDLPNTEVNGEGGLTLTAFTLVSGATGPELFAAVRNDGETPACEAGMRTDFFDGAGALVTSAASTLQSGRLYRFDDGSGVIIACVPPGEVAMTASTDLPESLVIAELARLEHQFPAFQVDGIVPIAGLAVGDLGAAGAVGAVGATTYTGTVTNGLDVTASNPKVSVFPLNRVGRPLAVATSSATLDVAPGGTWRFETSSVGDPGVEAAAYPAASIAQ